MNKKECMQAFELLISRIAFKTQFQISTQLYQYQLVGFNLLNYFITPSALVTTTKPDPTLLATYIASSTTMRSRISKPRQNYSEQSLMICLLRKSLKRCMQLTQTSKYQLCKL